MIKLEVDLYATINPNFDSIPYRLYINDELMAERDYVWDNTTHYITEIVPVFLDEGPHTIIIENLKPKNGSLKINTLKANGNLITLINDREFTV